jgi:hypothetical protein
MTQAAGTARRVLTVTAAAGALAFLTAGCGGDERPARSATAPAASTDAGGDQVDPTAPLPKARPKVVAPVAGERSQAEAEAARNRRAATSAEDDLSLPKPKGPATVSNGKQAQGPAVHDLQPNTATALPNGVALPPLEAPEAVMEVIRAGNTIARSPYKWGGGHGRFKDNGYDCSGSVSYALYAAGLIEGPRTSGQLESWGKPGKGRWITVYANGGHTFMEVAGIRFDTSGQARTGSRWQNEFRPTAGFVARHPPGL